MFQEIITASIEGHLKIWDDATGEILVDKRNAVNTENISIALAQSMAGAGGGIYEIHFGSGGTVVNDLGVLTYNSPRVTSTSAELYNPVYFKVVDANDTANNTNPSNNYMTSNHVNGLQYTDIVVNAVLDYTEPQVSDTVFNLAGIEQGATDTAEDFSGAFVFDEIGLKSRGTDLNTGLLLTHIVFHPVQKSANRLFRVRYTCRVRTA